MNLDLKIGVPLGKVLRASLSQELGPECLIQNVSNARMSNISGYMHGDIRHSGIRHFGFRHSGPHPLGTHGNVESSIMVATSTRFE